MTYIYSDTVKRVVRSEIRELLKLTRQPDVISFAGGLPDASLFPIEDIAIIANKILKEKGYLALQYGPTDGEKEMKEAASEFMAENGDNVAVDQICITSSSQQGLDLLTLLFIDPGAPIIIELPSYIGALQAFRRAGADMRGVKMDQDGVIIEEVEKRINELAKEGKKPRFIYIIPEYQNPSGLTTTVERRKRLIELAAKKEIPIVEDSPYREIAFTGERLPSIWSLAEGKGIIMLKTLSKMLFPGMRLGWMCAENEIIDKIIGLKQSVDLCSPSFNQFIVADYFKSGKMLQGLKKAISVYHLKAKAMLAALEKYMPEEVTWSKPNGGMFLWVVLPEHLDAKDVFVEAIKRKVAYVIGQSFHCDNSGTNTLRLNYSFPSLEQIDEGAKRLAEAIKSKL